MKFFIFSIFLLSCVTCFSQTRVNPVIKSSGGIFEIPYADEKPDPAMTYNIVVEVERPSEKPDTINWALNNVARLINLHAVGGVSPKNIHVVLAIHGGATYTVMNNEAYRAKYKVDNPNLKLYKELADAGVKIFVCGQSLIGREVDRMKMVPEVKVSVSMLTILTTYQLKGYAVLKF
ncbi:MAG TPA: DsrE family protein [Cyclobacteriaceae bacterium]|nr:DsrE family protein [Cyclobacteriaceae bacterium]